VTLARPRLVGLFVLGGILLGLAGIAALSAQRFLTEYRTYVVFFPYAVGGLKEGAPVTFRQVQVGRVRDVDLVFNDTAFRESRIMAVIDVRRSAFRNLEGKASQYSDEDLAKLMIAAGLRASVRSSSPIAGQRSVDLDFQPDQAPRLSGIPAPYPEIPSAPTGMEVINERIEATLKKISAVPVDEVIVQLGATLTSAQKALDQGNIPETLRQLRLTLNAGTHTLAQADKAMGGIDTVTAQAQTTLKGVDESMKGLQKAIDQMNVTLKTMNTSAEGFGDVRVETVRTLDEVNETMKAMRSLVETLQRHPEALLRGKAAPRKEK
jgi:paraquat-inducible protein B